MTNKMQFNIPSILNMSNFISAGETYEDNYIKGAIKGKYLLKTMSDSLTLPIDESVQQEFYMIKQMSANNLIADYVGSYFAHYLIDERAPIVHLVKDEKGNIYTASKFIPNFYGEDDYEVRYNGCIDEGCFIGEDGKIYPIKDNDYNLESYIPADKEEVYAAAEFVSYPDPNGRNNGIVISDTGVNFAVIDFDLSMTELSKPLALTYFQNNDRHKLIAALKSVTNKISKEFIEEALEQLFENIATLIPIESNELDTKKSQMAHDLINRLEIYKTDIILLEIQEVINSNSINQQELLDIKLSQFDSMVLSSSPSRVLVNTVGMIAGKHKAIFDKLDGFMKSYSQDDFQTILYGAKKAITMYKLYEGEDSEILLNLMPYIHSKDGFSTFSEILQSLLYRKQDSILTHKILAHLENFPETLYKCIDGMFSWWYGSNSKLAFNVAFPYIAGHDEYRDKIIDEAIHANKVFDAIVPYLSYEDQCSVPTLNNPTQCILTKERSLVDYNEEGSLLNGELALQIDSLY
ncbi:MAG: hypothetical protein WBJ81_03030 [Rickettsiales bacterium]